MASCELFLRCGPQQAIDRDPLSINECLKAEAEEWRRITPHAFGDDGLRWHARAFCHATDRKYKDFPFSRVLMLALRANRALSHLTINSGTNISMSFCRPTPPLAESKRDYCPDYDMADGASPSPFRKALLYYFRKRLRLDAADALDNPQEVPVVVANKDADASALAEAIASTRDQARFSTRRPRHDL